ncbi:MAG: GNAT family protein [Ignavibacteriaceae bacterium]
MEELLKITTEIETTRTILKRYKAGDGKKFYNIIEKNRDRMIDSFPVMLSHTNDEISAEYYVRNKIEEWEERSAFNFGIWSKEDGNFIGHISVKNIDWIIPRGEIAYIISKEYEGKGIMTEALTAIIKFSFEKLSLSRLFLRVMTNNIRSYELAERCGFSREGILRKDHKTYEGELVDLYYYGMTREDYKKFLDESSLMI